MAELSHGFDLLLGLIFTASTFCVKEIVGYWANDMPLRALVAIDITSGLETIKSVFVAMFIIKVSHNSTIHQKKCPVHPQLPAKA
jgi:hypothetical protein